MPHATLALTRLLLVLLSRADDDRERGDVPGWVLITIMTAGLVTTIWVAARDQLTQILQTALASVTGPGA